MKSKSLKTRITTLLLALPISLFSTVSQSDEQVLSQGLVSGQSTIAPEGNGVAEPNFVPDERPPAYTFFVEPNTDRNVRVVEFGDGSINALDGDALRRFAADGTEIFDNAFPVLCTNILVPQPKKNDPGATQSLSSCTSMLSLPDGTYRVFGSDKGKKLVGYKYDPATASCTAGWDPAVDSIDDRFCDGSLAVAGAPPQAAEAVVDSNDLTLSRAITADAYWLVADKNKVFLFELEEDTGTGQLAEVDSGKLIERISGKNLTGIAPFTDGQVIIADDDGLLYQLGKDGTGTWTTTVFTQMTLCTPDGNKTEQNFRLQSDANEKLLYVANQACGRIDILAPDPTNPETPPVTLMLDNNTADTESADFFPNDIDVIGAIIGSWDACTTSNSGLCSIGNKANEATVEGVQPTTSDGGANTFTGKKFVLQDCRYEDGTLDDGVACPVANCPAGAPINQCDLDVIALALIADPSFANLLPEPVPQGLLPWWLRADLDFPSSDGELVDNEATFFYYHIDTGSAFEDLATATYDIDIIRDNLAPGVSNELCPDPMQEFSVVEVNERTNMVAYLPDFFSTVRCKIDDPSQSQCGFDKSAIIMIDSCTNPKKAPTWGFSGHVVGVEAAFEAADTFQRIAALQSAELQAFKDKVLCDQFYAFPDGTLAGINRPGDDDAILSQGDCGSIQSDLDQIGAKLVNCLDAATPSQGNSAENCSALFTHIGNLETIIETGVLWPGPLDPTDPKDFLLLKSNPRGEFTGRVRAFSHSISNWWLGSNSAPLVQISAPADGFDAVAGTPIMFDATANDLEDGLLTDQIEWESDLIIGALGTGGSLTVNTSTDPLTVGTHVITASVIDGDGITSAASISVIITAP